MIVPVFLALYKALLHLLSPVVGPQLLGEGGRAGSTGSHYIDRETKVQEVE